MTRFLLTIMIMVTLFACKNEEEEVRLTAIKLDKTKLTLKVGEEYTFKVSTTPGDVPVPEYEWYLGSNKGVGKIDNNGKFTALKPGNVLVLVEVKDSWKGTGEYIKSECLVTVEAGQAQSIELNHTESTLKIGDAISLTAKLIPDYATDDEIVWESSNPQIAAIKKDDIFDKKASITALKEGEVTIKVSAKSNSSIYASCKIIVLPIKLEELFLSEKEKRVKQGEKFTLIPIFKPENASNKDVVWSSSNEAIATVDQEGNIETFNPGTCSIWVVSSDNNLKAECKVTVIERPIEDLIRASVYGSSTSINGYTTGDVTAAFYNNSNKVVEVSEFTMYDTRTNKVVYQDKDCGFVEYKKPLLYNLEFSRIYKPLFVWKYTCDGKTYEATYQM